MSENNLVILITVYVLFSFIAISSSEYVPVYMWETKQFPELVPAMRRMSSESFRSILEDQVSKNTPVLLFAEQNLSPEDFILHDIDGKTPFGQLSSIKKDAETSYFPSVKNPIKVVKELPGRTTIEESIESVAKNPNFALRDNDVLIVDLNDAREGESRLDMLKRHDGDIMTVYKRLIKEHGNIVTFFTGYHPSWITSEELRNHRSVRDAESQLIKAEPADDTTDNSTGTTYENEDILIHVTSPATFISDSLNTTLKDFHLNTTSKTQDQLEVSFTSKNTDLTINLIINFVAGYWKLQNIEIRNESAPENSSNTYLVVKDVYAPESFSYHCYKLTFSERNNAKVILTFPGLQMQPYLNSNVSHVFGDPYDCVGFMTAPIWSGLFVTFILVLIMTFGLSMMMDIKTMDRFDDPKGKTITIGATE